MGCSGSRHDKPLPSVVKKEWKKYEELVSAMFADPLKGPTEEHVASIKSCTISALEPEDETDPPLLFVAKDHDEWFRLLIQKMDPMVTWKDRGQEKTLGSMLAGDNFTLWCQRKEEWERERLDNEMDVPPARLSWSNDRWWSEFGPALSGLGLGVAAGAGIVLGSAAALGVGFPLVAVGPLIWQAIKNWQASLRQCAPSPHLTPLFSFHAKAVGATLQELNDRLQVARAAAAEAPGNAQAKQEYQRQAKHVELLQVLLEDQTEKVNIVARGKMNDKAKKDEMVKMLQELLEFQRELNAELMQEHVSDLLERSESRLASIERLLSHYLTSCPPPHFSRSQSLALDADVNDCPQRAPKTNRAVSEHGRTRNNVSFFYDVCPSCSEHSHSLGWEEESKSTSSPRHE